MNDDQSKKRLGRGLAALIGDMSLNNSLTRSPGVEKLAEFGSVSPNFERFIPLEAISCNPHNPRRHFTEAELDNLAQSIRQHGIVQPVIVRPLRENPQRFELIAGERRWRAAQRAHLSQLPVIIRDVDDKTALELAIIENVQRADLNPIEEAMGYELLLNEHGYTQVDLAQVIGKSRSHVANTLRLLKLPEKVQQFLTDGQLSAGHARCLITVDNPQDLAEKIIREGLSVRQTEVLAYEQANPKVKKRTSVEKDAETKSLEKLLANVIGMKVIIRHGKKGGDLKIHYSSLEQLDDICRRLQS
ncbi:ParB/RepB/Spo0J family partition protein [Bartonella krasnovii]|uniref:ParB/RepB/Spo0J family partition protein n=1 Tax=Bartonella krasnovii TaxID=2267275 RepID=A0A5B9D3R7_9HYPH|nr:ParB/RepB/Spo0J family partition protein [Bartonella krasnovii]QEE12989.1 ParB/RepB/Spo0J family partition protein [Bartonella krasnovii]UNF29108.1 ParB/RepB/Spo0J family partition protein [Bartonella krasnovii]UNF35465.1 ParB/RepB/Spo0J family partition protein [Bartonella krasnovii]UNF37080.1 ParB/RepB/Spo0J family partition protein [Bartonella krasnovii]UNF38780.1 ParB/RepB/Spo0J family partition protein [Bartonella krasnovii]